MTTIGRDGETGAWRVIGSGTAPRDDGSATRREMRAMNMTIPLYRALVKVANAGIGNPGTARKAQRLLRKGLIRRVRGTSGYEITALGARAICEFEADIFEF